MDRSFVPTDQVIKPAGSQITFGGRSTVVALSPDGTKAAFVNGRGVAPVVVIDLIRQKVLQLFDPTHENVGAAGFEGSSASIEGIIYSHHGMLVRWRDE